MEPQRASFIRVRSEWCCSMTGCSLAVRTLAHGVSRTSRQRSTGPPPLQSNLILTDREALVVQKNVRRAKARFSSGCKSRPATFAPAGSNRSSRGGNKAAEAFGVEGHVSDSAIMQAVTRVNVEQASKNVMRKPTRHFFGEGCYCRGSERSRHPAIPPG
jgi:hypothetical protein